MTVGAKDHVGRPELHHQRQARTFVPRPINGEGLVAMLEAVTIRAMVHAPAIKGLDALKFQQEILQPVASRILRAVTVDPSAHVTENSFPRGVICVTWPANSVTVS